MQVVQSKASLPRARRLLIPLTCDIRPSQTYVSPRGAGAKSVAAKLARNRGDSVSSDVLPPALRDTRWFNTECKWDIVAEETQIEGFQIYAVEKWVVQRTTPVVWLTVYTGETKDKVTITAISPPSSLSEAESQIEWEKVLHDLRRDGARPHETSNGVIMVTSLANFRSDFTIVHIPGGDFRVHRERLYMNINLLRMGCSGRSALSLQEPSDSTKDRFLTTYRFRDTTRSDSLFTSTVLVLVTFVQTSLALFDAFSPNVEEYNGLLCDITVEGIRRWVMEVGEPHLKVEPSERVADPITVSALFSLVLALRHKLHTLCPSQTVPKDPFLAPLAFMYAVSVFVSGSNSRHQSPIIPSSTAASTLSISTSPFTPLTLTIIRRIDAAYEKVRSTDALRVHRVLLNKLDELTAATSSVMSSTASASHSFSSNTQETAAVSSSSGHGTSKESLEATPDLASLVRRVTHSTGKDGMDSLRYLWTGRPDALEMKRREVAKVGVWSDGERDEDHEKDKHARFAEEDGEYTGASPWSNKMQKKIESWAGREFGRVKSKKLSTDASSHNRRRSRSPEVNANKVSPTVIISSDPLEPPSGLSSGQASPTSGRASPSMLAIGALPSAQTSSINMDDVEYERRIHRFNNAQRPFASPTGSRAISWSDTRAAELQFQQAADNIKSASTSALPQENEEVKLLHQSKATLDDLHIENHMHTKGIIVCQLKRYRSSDDVTFLDDEAVLHPSHMEIDVELAGQCLTMRRRQLHVEASIAVLQTILQTVSSSNEILRQELHRRQERVQDLSDQSYITNEVDKARYIVNKVARDSDALEYETMGFNVRRLWQQAAAPRHRVFEIRKRVSGARVASFADAGHSHPIVHGRFNRIQTALDGTECLVDWMGRTEEEVAEEADLPENMPMEDELSDDGTTQMVARRLGPTNGWFLDLFTRWGKSLGMRRGNDVPKGEGKTAEHKVSAPNQ